MRCQACNVILNTQESIRRFKGSGEFVDLCNKCLGTISEDVQTTEGNYDEHDEKYEE